MERHIDGRLRDLKDRLLGMAGLVESAVEHAIHALQSRDRGQVDEVFLIERQVNQAHLDVDAACLNLLALDHPLAMDLRLILAIIKINSDLERMGDQAVNIAHNATRYLQGEPLKPLIDLPLMFDEAKIMVRDALNCFVRTDIALAEQVLERDDRVDSLRDRIFRDVIELLKSRPAEIEQGMNLILIARNLEKIGDHASNIAESVIFAVSGKDIRHSRKGTPPGTMRS